MWIQAISNNMKVKETKAERDELTDKKVYQHAKNYKLQFLLHTFAYM